LIDTLAQKGIRPGVYKPIETGVEDKPLDATALLDACCKVNDAFAKLTTDDITAYTFSLPAAPFCADDDRIIDTCYLIDKYDWLRRRCDILLIEGAGGLLVPITETYTMLHLIKDTDAHALLVTPSRLGCINETLLSMMALRHYDVAFDWCVNLYEDKETFDQVTRPYYDTVFPNWWTLQDGLDGFLDRYVTATTNGVADRS